MSGSNFQRRVWSAASTEPIEEKSTLDDSEHLGDAQQQVATPLLWLVVSRPLQQRGTIISIPANTTFGRNADVCWGDSLVSRQHARFILTDVSPASEQLQFAIVPQQDRNGTFVNGKRVQGPLLLHENDLIEMGNTQFVVKVLY